MNLLKYFTPLMVGLCLAAPAVAAEHSSTTARTTTVGSDAAWIPTLGKIKPAGPFRLWTAINKVLPEYAALKGGKELRSRIDGMSAGQFKGRNPGDVMAQTEIFRAILEDIRDQLKLSEIKTYKDPLGRKITPAVVFLNSGHVLDALVETLYMSSKKSADALGRFYDVPYVAGKTPGDVFGLVHLATRRLQLIAGS